VSTSVPESTILEFSFLHNDFYLPGMIGVFGWFDTYAPTFTYIVWYGLIGFVTLAAAAVGRRRDALTLLVFTIAIVVVPVAISTSQVHRYGFTWAGKDTLAFAVGLPILAATVMGRSALAEHRARIGAIVALLAFLAQVAAFFEMLRRYAVGTKGPDFGFLLHPVWEPPISLPDVLAIETLSLGLLAVLAYSLLRGSTTRLAPAFARTGSRELLPVGPAASSVSSPSSTAQAEVTSEAPAASAESEPAPTEGAPAEPASEPAPVVSAPEPVPVAISTEAVLVRAAPTEAAPVEAVPAAATDDAVEGTAEPTDSIDTSEHDDDAPDEESAAAGDQPEGGASSGSVPDGELA
jgi:hypothetical protein